MAEAETVDRGDEVDDSTEEISSSTESEETTEAQSAANEDKVDAAAETETETDTEEEVVESKGPMIPKSRLDFKNEKLKQTTAKLEDLQAQLNTYKKGEETQEPASTIESLLADINTEIAEAVENQDGAKVAQLQAASQELLMEHMRGVAEQTSTAASSASTEQLRLDDMIDALEAKHGVLDQNSDDFDADISEEVVDMYETFVLSGKYNRPDAMAKAVKSILGDDIKKDLEISEGKRVTNIDKNLKAAGQNPPDTDKAGMDSDKAGVGEVLDSSKLSDAEFNALPESTKARMRGDFL